MRCRRNNKRWCGASEIMPHAPPPPRVFMACPRANFTLTFTHCVRCEVGTELEISKVQREFCMLSLRNANSHYRLKYLRI